MTMDMEARIGQLEQTIAAIRRDLAAEQRNLRELGLRNGSRGVAAAFVLVGGIFILNVVFKVWSPQGELFTFKEFLWLVGLVIVGLLFYFAFIFGYNMLLDYKAGRLGADRPNG